MNIPKFTIFLIIAISLTSIYGFGNIDFFNKFSFSVNGIRKRKEFSRVLTSSFVHVDILHLFFNVFTLHSFASVIEFRYSPQIMMISFFLGVLFGNLFSLAKNWKVDRYTAVGASGGVCSILYTSVFLTENGSIYMMFIPVPIPDRIFAVLFILVSYILMKKGRDKIGHDAHIGGALIGTIVAICIAPFIIFQEYIVIGAMFIPFLGLLAYEKIVKARN